jgi:hypothetical protein
MTITLLEGNAFVRSPPLSRGVAMSLAARLAAMGRCCGACLARTLEVGDDIEGTVTRFARACDVVLYEVIGARVLRVGAEPKWIEGPAAEHFLAACNAIGGSAPYSMFPELIESDLYVPNLGESRTLSLAGSRWDGKSMTDMDEIIVRLGAFIEELPGEAHVEHWKELLARVKSCRRHRMVFWLSE